jgi:hypothetical protein
VDVYLAIGSVWSQSAVAPKRSYLAVLLEGTELFPDHVDLLWLAADLHHRHGYDPEAAALARQGLQVPGDAAQRARFADLLTRSGPSRSDQAP